MIYKTNERSEVAAMNAKQSSFGSIEASAAPVAVRRSWLGRMRKGSQFLEYALLAALIGIVVAVGAMHYGRDLLNLFNALGKKTAEAVPQNKR